MHIRLFVSILNQSIKSVINFLFAEVRARFCKTFSAILKQIEKETTTKEYADALCKLNVEYQNFKKLFTDVIYCTEDTYHVFIDLAATTVAGGAIMFTTMATYGTCRSFTVFRLFYITFRTKISLYICRIKCMKCRVFNFICRIIEYFPNIFCFRNWYSVL